MFTFPRFSQMSVDKIYSRTRIKLPKIFNAQNSKMPKEKRNKIIKIMVIVIIAIFTMKLILDAILPIFDKLCEDKAKAIATVVSNDQATFVMSQHTYDELYTIEKDETGNTLIRANVVPINNLISDLTERIQNEFNKVEEPEITIPVGALSGLYFLSGAGPNISIKISVTGTVDTDIKSEFIAQGINQTLHRVYVVFDCNMKIITPTKTYEKQVLNQVIIAENVIVGNIPDSYYNLEGFSSPGETLDLIH